MQARCGVLGRPSVRAPSALLLGAQEEHGSRPLLQAGSDSDCRVLETAACEGRPHRFRPAACPPPSLHPFAFPAHLGPEECRRPAEGLAGGLLVGSWPPGGHPGAG